MDLIKVILDLHLLLLEVALILLRLNQITDFDTQLSDQLTLLFCSVIDHLIR